MRHVRARMAALLFAATVAATSAQAQETINYASVSGRVSDAQGGVVAGAHVSARQTETNVSTKR